MAPPPTIGGIDIGGVYYSSTVYAAKAGTVIISSSNSVRGQYIVISHGSGNTTTYQHLSKRSVSVGAVVKQGQAIGRDRLERRRQRSASAF